MKKIYIILLIIMINLIFTSLTFSNDDIRNWTEKYNNLLKKYISKSKIDNIVLNVIDYENLAKNQIFYKLNENLKDIKSIETLSKEEKIAFWINVYNYLTLLKVVENPGIKSIKDLNNIFMTVWQKQAGIVSGKEVSLDYIEHETLRKEFREPLIHFAIVCASVSCPDLRNEAYRGKDLYDQLIDQAKKFLDNDAKGLNIDKQKKIITLSKIFYWYRADFDDPVHYIINKGFLDKKYENYKIKYFNYNWNLNEK